MIVNDKLEGIWKGEIVAYFKTLYQHLSACISSRFLPASSGLLT